MMSPWSAQAMPAWRLPLPLPVWAAARCCLPFLSTRSPICPAIRPSAARQKAISSGRSTHWAAKLGKAADACFLQSRMLNRGKGPAVHSLRVQADRVPAYHKLHETGLRKNATPGDQTGGDRSDPDRKRQSHRCGHIPGRTVCRLGSGHRHRNVSERQNSRGTGLL